MRDEMPGLRTFQPKKKNRRGKLYEVEDETPRLKTS